MKHTIKQLFHIEAPQLFVLDNLSTINGLAGWWTFDTQGSSELSKIISFRFGLMYLIRQKRYIMKNIGIFSLLLVTLAAPAQDRKLQVEANHSTIGFSISIAGFSEVTGKFTDFEIFLDWSDSEMIATNILADIKATSINTGIVDRDTHLRTADFFDVEKYPNITFKSDSIVRVNFSQFNAHGNFSMHGVSKKVVLPFTIVKRDGNTIGFKCLTTINRLDYGVASDFKHTTMPGFLSEEIEVQIVFWTKKRKEE